MQLETCTASFANSTEENSMIQSDINTDNLPQQTRLTLEAQ